MLLLHTYRTIQNLKPPFNKNCENLVLDELQSRLFQAFFYISSESALVSQVSNFKRTFLPFSFIRHCFPYISFENKCYKTQKFQRDILKVISGWLASLLLFPNIVGALRIGHIFITFSFQTVSVQTIYLEMKEVFKVV